MVNFWDIFISEEQSTPLTFPLLFSEEYAQGSTKHVMVPEPLTPVQEVAVMFGIFMLCCNLIPKKTRYLCMCMGNEGLFLGEF